MVKEFMIFFSNSNGANMIVICSFMSLSSLMWHALGLAWLPKLVSLPGNGGEVCESNWAVTSGDWPYLPSSQLLGTIFLVIFIHNILTSSGSVFSLSKTIAILQLRGLKKRFM